MAIGAHEGEIGQPRSGARSKFRERDCVVALDIAVATFSITNGEIEAARFAGKLSGGLERFGLLSISKPSIALPHLVDAG